MIKILRIDKLIKVQISITTKYLSMIDKKNSKEHINLMCNLQKIRTNMRRVLTKLKQPEFV